MAVLVFVFLYTHLPFHIMYCFFLNYLKGTLMGYKISSLKLFHMTLIQSVLFNNLNLVVVSIGDQEVLYVNLKKKTPATLPIPVPSPKLSSFQRLKIEPTEDTVSFGSHANEGFSEEHTYYNTKEDLSKPLPGVPVERFNNYIKGKENTKDGFKDEFSVSIS